MCDDYNSKKIIDLLEILIKLQSNGEKVLQEYKNKKHKEHEKWRKEQLAIRESGKRRGGSNDQYIF